MRLSFLLLLPCTTFACIQYSATYPFAPDLPFEAYISDNNTVVCWISRTYNGHNLLQNIANLAPETKEQLAHPDELTWGFKRWDFTCLEGHQGWANVGVRSMGYIGRDGKVTQWVAEMIEDVWDENWVYWKEIGCAEERREKLQRELLERSKGAMMKIEEMEKQKAELSGKKEDMRRHDGIRMRFWIPAASISVCFSDVGLDTGLRRVVLFLQILTSILPRMLLHRSSSRSCYSVNDRLNNDGNPVRMARELKKSWQTARFVYRNTLLYWKDQIREVSIQYAIMAPKPVPVNERSNEHMPVMQQEARRAQQQMQQQQQRLKEQKIAQQQALQYYPHKTSQPTSQAAPQQRAYQPLASQRGVPSGLISLPTGQSQAPPAGGGYPTNTQYYPPSYPPLATAPQAQGPSASSGGFPTNTQPYQQNRPGIQSFVPPPRGNPPVQGHPASGVGFPTNAQYYSGPPVHSSAGRDYSPFLPTAPPVQFPSARSGGIVANAPSHQVGPPGRFIQRSFNLPPVPGAPPVQVPSAGSGGAVKNPHSRESYPPGLSVDRQFDHPPPPPPPPAAALPRLIKESKPVEDRDLHPQLHTGTPRPSTAKASQPKKPKSTGKHPHTEPRMCEQETRTFVGCPCKITTLKSCKGDTLADRDPSALTKCEAFQEVTGNKTGNCKGQGDHWACPAMVKFWSEKKIECDGGSFIWV